MSAFRVPVAAALLVGALAVVAMPAATGAAPACAAATGPHAGLVVDTGQRTTAYCVALDGPTVSGLRLLQLAADQDGLSYGLGFGGQAVCRLAGVGPGGGDCWADYPSYWGYWRGDGGGGWTWSGLGAASTTVRDGDVDAWTWGTGMSGTTHPKPPSLSIEEICVAPPSSAASGAPSPAPSPTRAPSLGADRTHASSPGPTHGSSLRSPAGPPSTTSSPVVVLAAGAATPPPARGGPPAGVLVALVLAIVLALAGWLRLRAHPGGARR